MIAELLLAAVCTLPLEDVVVDRCESVDVNRVYPCDGGDPTFTQLVFSDFNMQADRFDVRAWRMQKPGMEPIRVGEWYVTIWFDGDTMRAVYARSRIRSWGIVDWELEQRRVLPQAQRRGLSQ